MWFILTNQAPVLGAGASGMRSLPSSCYQPREENRYTHMCTGWRRSEERWYGGEKGYRGGRDGLAALRTRRATQRGARQGCEKGREQRARPSVFRPSVGDGIRV